MLTDVGCKRDHNEDSILFVRPSGEQLSRKGMLAIVADGMGGHQAGDYASRLAVEEVSRHYYTVKGRSPIDELRQSFSKANAELFRIASGNPRLRGMGTTATALVLLGRAAYFAHVGDSRLYRISGGQAEMLSEDHTLVGALLKSGVLTAEQAMHSPERHVITRAIGSQPDVEIMTSRERLTLRANDRFVLCSDGLHDLVAAEEIRDALFGRSPQEACNFLIELAKGRGGHDNISVIIVRVAAESAEKKEPPTTQTYAITAEGKVEN